jgi:hypothetical protein
MGEGEFGPARCEDILAAHLLDAHLPLAFGDGIDNQLPGTRPR